MQCAKQSVDYNIAAFLFYVYNLLFFLLIYFVVTYSCLVTGT